MVQTHWNPITTPTESAICPKYISGEEHFLLFYNVWTSSPQHPSYLLHRRSCVLMQVDPVNAIKNKEKTNKRKGLLTQTRHLRPSDGHPPGFTVL